MAETGHGPWGCRPPLACSPMPSEAAEAAGSSAQAFQACRPLSRGPAHEAAPQAPWLPGAPSCPGACPTPCTSLAVVSSASRCFPRFSWLFMKTRAEKKAPKRL